MSRFQDVILIGTVGSQPLATAVAVGTLYSQTDGTPANNVQRSNGTTWDDYSPSGGGAGTVTTSGSPASGNITKFSGGTAITNGDLSGDVSTSGTLATTIGALKVATGMIQASAVTLAKIQNAAASSKLVGSGASGSGAAYAELTLGTNLTMSGTTLNASGGGTFAFVRKPTDQSVTSSTTFVNDADLTWNVGANETWVYEFALVVNGASGTGRMKAQLTVPTGTTGSILLLGPAFNSNDNNGPAYYVSANGITATVTFIGMAGTSKSVSVLIKGVAVSSTTTGAITLQWAQNDSSATATTVQTNSYLLATRVAP